MTSDFPVLRFLRDCEAGLRDLAEKHPDRMTPDLIRLADDVSTHAERLVQRLIEAGLMLT
jgi:hypothetical protein